MCRISYTASPFNPMSFLLTDSWAVSILSLLQRAPQWILLPILLFIMLSLTYIHRNRIALSKGKCMFLLCLVKSPSTEEFSVLIFTQQSCYILLLIKITYQWLLWNFLLIQSHHQQIMTGLLLLSCIYMFSFSCLLLILVQESPPPGPQTGSGPQNC